MKKIKGVIGKVYGIPPIIDEEYKHVPVSVGESNIDVNQTIILGNEYYGKKEEKAN